MEALLTSDLCGWPSSRVETLQDMAAPPELARKLVELTKGVQDVLLLYYVGHGMRIPNGQLALALRDTSSNRTLLRHTAMVYKDIADILRGCPAATKLVFLDCCHAELGNRASDQFQSADIDAEPVDGLYCIWASKEWEKARSPISGGLTYFTGAFVNVVRAGIPGKPSQLTIDQIFTELRARLLRANLPEPAQSGIRDAHHWPFARNAAPPETHRDPDQEIASLTQRLAEFEGMKAATDAKVLALQAEVERFRAQASHAGTAQERRELQSAIDTAERLLDDTVAAEAAAGAAVLREADTVDDGSAPDSMRRLGRMPFKGKGQLGALPASPEALYRDLPRKPDAVPGLWVHQGDLLRAYAADHVDTPDLALELPTGTGKTLPGLVIADWVRRVRSARVAYACPTVQLARQVAETAEREGVPTVVLVRSHRDWPVADQARYEAAEAVAIVTYSTVFNSSPKLAAADLLVLDDAHAGEQYVAEQYAVDIRRGEQPDAYDQILTALSPALDRMLVQRLRDPNPDPSAHQQVRLVAPLRQPGVVEALDAVLARIPAPYRFRYAMIRGGLPACLVYLSYSSVLARPLIPPTSEPLFTKARQRLYLSATLGDGGELERAFGRAGIVRLALPKTSPVPRSGRRFFVFPELVEGADPGALATAIVARRVRPWSSRPTPGPPSAGLATSRRRTGR